MHNQNHVNFNSEELEARGRSWSLSEQDHVNIREYSLLEKSWSTIKINKYPFQRVFLHVWI